jgi:hypothetical protein
MATEITVKLENRPGTLAEMSHVLGDAKINIEAIQLVAHDDYGSVQLVVDDPEQALRVLKAAGLPVESRLVLVVNVLNEPGGLGDVAMVMADAGINIDATYVTIDGKVVMGVDDLDGAIQVAAGMAVMTYR